MAFPELDRLRAEIADMQIITPFGLVTEVSGGTILASGLRRHARLGDRVALRCRGERIGGEVIGLGSEVQILADRAPEGLAIGDRVELLEAKGIAPDTSWIGRVIDPFGQPLDGRPLARGPARRDLRADPPPAAHRRRLGPRLETGLCAFNTMLPLVRGQRIGLFAGSGVGKSTLLAQFARGVSADVVVLALIGERGRELREFIEKVLGPEGMARSVIVAATSDQSPLIRRRCAWAAMTVAEFFRDQGKQVLFLADSVTRFAEAHREVALAGGEAPSLRGFPPSVSHQIMSLAERAGPGVEGSGDITAIFSVLVAGSDMEEPVADILRGTLDGHVVLDRAIAERGRFPAVDLLRSVSRSLPDAASAAENALIAQARRLLGAYDRAEMMIQAGLYAAGSDPAIDAAIRVWPALDAFLGEPEPVNAATSFTRLAQALAGAEAP
ncbi:FliI/YscN family ATPase [Sinirhodobacter populi]|uniref:FliI/YscN family ATPase n=1 Tax=Paenirhodobacter populi TaxID=2306993 RepID=A0A443KDF9_9RHOB|nr:FliI/YscN family ATPase [Sinirhodobacter populi]RWR30857.1 FliI/YscN family ATPase [Sinirhodobacter populi]